MWLFKKRASSKFQINIKEVRDGILTLPGRRYRLILNVSSINLDLQSEVEQDRILDSYKNLLNSLTFPVQILMRVRELDLESYQKGLSVSGSKEKDATYKKLLSDYQDFVTDLVQENRILSRSFYLVIPIEGKRLSFSKAKEELHIRRDIVIKSLETIGLRARTLSTLEILLLFYHFYNEVLAKTQPLQEVSFVRKEAVSV